MRNVLRVSVTKHGEAALWRMGDGHTAQVVKIRAAVDGSWVQRLLSRLRWVTLWNAAYTHPDLAEARAEFPEHQRLWDAVDHDRRRLLANVPLATFARSRHGGWYA